tara:strand:- start:241 stop:867 length:627 start_codon:yes stop_codon:yes gene_type:complete
MKYIMIIVMVSLLGACSSIGNYKIKSESGKVVNTVPKWYMADIKESKACDLSMWTKKDNNKTCIYGMGTAVSPSLDLAVEKAKLKAKAELADLVKGEMNKQSKIFAKEVGASATKKQVANDFETVTVNEIKATVVKGYEVFEQDVTLTANGNYRAWVGLRLPLGEFNKLYEYNAEQILNAYKVQDKSKEAYSSLMKKDEGSNENRNIQ